MSDYNNLSVRDFEHREEDWEDFINFGFEEHEAQGHIISLHEYYHKKNNELKDNEERGIVDQELKHVTEIYETGIFLHHFNLYEYYLNYSEDVWFKLSQKERTEKIIQKRELQIEYCFSKYKEQIQERLKQISPKPDKQLLLYSEIIINETLLSHALIPEVKYKLSLIRKAIVWLNELKEFVTKEPQNIMPEFEKIQTSMTVNQIALLFRILKDLELIDMKQGVPNLSKAISSIFSTKRATNISENSIKNHFETPTEEAIRFWQDKKQTIQTIINKYKENISK